MPEYDRRVNLEHIKPHKPLMGPPVTNIITNVNNMVRNNIHFSITIHLKNRMAGASFFPLAYTGDNRETTYYKELPFERYGLFMSDYEWYLHTSRLKDIYNKQKRFISIMRQRQAAQNSFLEIVQANSPDINFFSTHNSKHAAPAIYYIAPKTDSSSASHETRTTSISTSEQNESHRQISTETKTEGRTIPQTLNIDNIASRAAKIVEEKLRHDSLKRR